MEAEAETKVLARGTKSQAEPVPPVEPSPSTTPSTVDLLAARPLVGRYELIHKLGHGGMATVYLGRSVGTAGFERLVAIKVIHPHLASEPEFVEMFLDEARIAAKIHHSHVVEIIDLGQDDDLFFMVMEYVEGDTLSSLLRQCRRSGQRLPLGASLRILADACEGLAAAHELRDREGEPLHLVHRDVSPHNLLLGLDGRVKVVDFGIMKAAGKRSNTLTGQLRGKLAYMSPEQAKGRAVDLRTDVFALGAVMWELLANERLFSGDSESETLERVLRCDVPDIREHCDDLPDDVVAIVERALAASPDDRYDSAKQMLRDVRAAMRRLDDEEEPREVLAAIARRTFDGRVRYIQAAVRAHCGEVERVRSGVFTSAGSSSAALPSIIDRTRTTPLGASSTAGSSDVHRLTPSDVKPVESQTLTTSVGVGGVPARHWTLWLLLPLIGAAIGTATVRLSRSETAEAAVMPAPEPQPRPEPVAVTPKTEASTVKWWFNGSPQGATITIDGQRHAELTPTSIELPRGEDTVTVLIEKEGYKPWEGRLAPLGPENHAYRLELEVPPQPIETHPHFKVRSKPRAKSPSAEASTPTPTSGGLELEPVPDREAFLENSGKR